MSEGRFDPELVRAFKFYGTISFNIAGSMALGFAAGYALDAKFGTRPCLAVVGFLLGALAGFWGVYKLVMSEFRDRPPNPKS
ncbi:MAG: AtpZ/AtpI family protein [Firmicutes bacterium]|nr:AtpZ/AtpI family protein [Bacillota bacterium]MDH7495843.1 AtpZ/AtpI family protein [Bacillota bacterium]